MKFTVETVSLMYTNESLSMKKCGLNVYFIFWGSGTEQNS